MMFVARFSTRVTGNKRRVDYYVLEHPKLPRAERVNPAKDKLYGIDITDSESLESGVVHRVHYVGYSHRWDEWKRADEIVTRQPSSKNETAWKTTYPTKFRS